MKRLFVDIKEDHRGNLMGPLKFPADSVFVLEVLAEVIQKFSEACEVPAKDICEDLKGLVK